MESPVVPTMPPGPVLLAAVAMSLLGALGDSVNAALEYDRQAIEAFEWWRLVTAHAAHLGFLHGLLNGVGLLVVWHIGREVVSRRAWAWLLTGSLLAVDAGLYFGSPDIEWYVGASGVLHGLFGGMAVLMLGRGSRSYAALLLLALTAKLVGEQYLAATPIFPGAEIGNVITAAHLYGAVGGVATATWFRTSRSAG